MGLPDERRGGREDEQGNEQEDEREDGREDERESPRKEAKEQLHEALTASDAKETDYHIRQAIQLLQLED